jgi:hypothetical protein
VGVVTKAVRAAVQAPGRQPSVESEVDAPAVWWEAQAACRAYPMAWVGQASSHVRQAVE